MSLEPLLFGIMLVAVFTRGLVVLRLVPGGPVRRQHLNEQAQLHDLKPVLRWMAFVILIYLHCTRGTVLEAESRPNTPYRSYSDRRGLEKPPPRFGRAEESPHLNGRHQLVFYQSFHPEWAWFWTTMGEDQWRQVELYPGNFREILINYIGW